MVNSIRKVMSRLLMAAVLFLAPVLFMNAYQRDAQLAYIETLSEALLKRVSDTGVLTYTDYQMYAEALARLNAGYEAGFSHVSYVETPYYEYLSAAELETYFSERNLYTATELSTSAEIPVLEDAQAMTLQTESNATIFSAAAGEYVPLPDETETPESVTYTALRAVQEVYDGEPLITVCLAETPEGYYYVAADPVAVTGEGTGVLELTLKGEPIGAYVSVTVYPRLVTCENHHCYPCTKEVIRLKTLTGVWGGCPYCALEVKKIRFYPDAVTTVIGTELADTGVYGIVTYMDGHVETVLPDAEGFFTDFDAVYCGVQEVTASYKGFTAKGLTVTTKGGACILCGAECSERNLSDYVREKRCNRCLSGMPFYAGTKSVEERVMTKGEITERLENDGEYRMSRGSYLEIEVRQTGKTGRFFLGRFAALPFVYGEYIRTQKEGE